MYGINRFLRRIGQFFCKLAVVKSRLARTCHDVSNHEFELPRRNFDPIPESLAIGRPVWLDLTPEHGVASQFSQRVRSVVVSLRTLR